MCTSWTLTHGVRSEEELGASESLVANGNDLSDGFLQAPAADSSLHFLIQVKGDVGEFLVFAFAGNYERYLELDQQRPFN